MNNTKQRNINIDLIKCIAVLSVICVHFFLNSKFYTIPINNTPMYIMTAMRTLFMICVPLFILTTGYLMANKELSPKYYKGIIKTISIYLIASLFCLAYKHFHLHNEVTFISAIKEILKYNAAPYSWYIEMYIGLFLIIPFLNLIFNGLKTDKQRLALVITMICVTILPSLFNLTRKIYPAYFVSLYPITYYFTGAFIRKCEKQYLNKWIYLILFIATVAVSSLVNIHICKGQIFKWISLNYWEGVQNYLSSLFLFVFFSRLKLDKTPKAVAFVIQKISELSLGIYLLSYIGDNLIYEKLNAQVTAMPEKLKYFVLVTGCVFVISLLLSMLANFIYYIIHKLCHTVHTLIKN